MPDILDKSGKGNHFVWDGADRPAQYTATVPAWFLNMPSMTWQTPLSNTLNDVFDPLNLTTNAGTGGRHQMVSSESCLGVDQTRKRVINLAQGGHGDGFSNAGYEVDLRAANPQWVRYKDSSANPGGVAPAGFPRSTHGYRSTESVNGRDFEGCMNSPAPTGSGGAIGQGQCWELNRDTGAWTNRGVVVASSYVSGAAVVYDPVAEHLIFIGDQNPCVKRVSLAGGAFTLADQLNVSRSDFNKRTMAAVDTTNRVLLVRSGAEGDPRGWNTGIYHSLSLTNISQGWSTFTPSGTQSDRYDHFMWHAPSSAFLSWHRGTGLRKMTVTVDGTGRYSAGVWTSVAVAGTQPIENNPAGLQTTWANPGPPSMHAKFHMVNDMGNGQALIVCVPQYGGSGAYPKDFYCCKIPGAI